jgi:hypothetical protein
MMVLFGISPVLEILCLQILVGPSPGTDPYGSLEEISHRIDSPIPMMELLGSHPVQEVQYLKLFVLLSPGTGLCGSLEGWVLIA